MPGDVQYQGGRRGIVDHHAPYPGIVEEQRPRGSNQRTLAPLYFVHQAGDRLRRVGDEYDVQARAGVGVGGAVDTEQRGQRRQRIGLALVADPVAVFGLFQILTAKPRHADEVLHGQRESTLTDLDHEKLHRLPRPGQGDPQRHLSLLVDRLVDNRAKGVERHGVGQPGLRRQRCTRIAGLDQHVKLRPRNRDPDSGRFRPSGICGSRVAGMVFPNTCFEQRRQQPGQGLGLVTL